MLSIIIASHLFPTKPNKRNKKRTTFQHFKMEKLYLVRKLALVKEIRKFDRKMADTITKLNALRNAVAHSFAPELRRDYRKTKKYFGMTSILIRLRGSRGLSTIQTYCSTT